MKSWSEHTHFAGLDWAEDHHDLVVVDAKTGEPGRVGRKVSKDGTIERYVKAKTTTTKKTAKK